MHVTILPSTALYGRLEKNQNFKKIQKKPIDFPLRSTYSTVVCVCVCVRVFPLSTSHSTPECVCNQGGEEKNNKEQRLRESEGLSMRRVWWEEKGKQEKLKNKNNRRSRGRRG
jgi:hypothetical protein